MKPGMPQSPEAEQGEFNQAISYQYRLHMILAWLDQATINGDYKQQYLLLKSFFKEIVPMMNPEEREKNTQKSKEAKTACDKIMAAILSRQKSFDAKNVDVLDEWEISLRDVMQKKNMLMPKKRDPRYALGGK